MDNQKYVWFTECGIVGKECDEADEIAHHQLHEFTFQEATEIIMNWIDWIDGNGDIKSQKFEYDFHRFEVTAIISEEKIVYYMAFKKAVLKD